MALGNMGAVGRGEYSDQVYIPGQPAEPVSDYQSKAVFENFLREQGGDAEVESFISENPDAFLTPAQMNKLNLVGPEAFWNQGDGSPKSVTVDNVSTDTGNVPTNVTLVNTVQDPDTGMVTGYFSDGTSKVLTPGSMSQKERDAYAILEDTFRSYNLESLVPVIRGYMEANLGSEQAALQLKMDPAYQRRFYGNKLRVEAGKNAISEAAYLDLENQYNETLSAYGLKGYFGTTRDQQIAGMAQIVGNDISAPEFADRIGTVVDRVQNADPNVKAALQGYYGINDNDLIKFYLNPKEGLAQLKQKTTAAEIGAASYEQLGKTGTIGAARAMELAQAGVDQATAMKGYATIGQILPETKKLSDIYGEAGINYTQQEAEKEVFNLGDAASAQRKRKRLAQLEAAKFSGDSGVSSQASSLGSAVRGQF
jgi:hypothetical protein